jgi:hypothetical protein
MKIFRARSAAFAALCTSAVNYFFALAVFRIGQAQIARVKLSALSNPGTVVVQVGL